MNTLNETIVEILEEPKVVTEDIVSHWEVKVLVDCYGCKQEKIFQATTRKEIDKYRRGYTYQV